VQPARAAGEQGRPELLLERGQAPPDGRPVDVERGASLLDEVFGMMPQDWGAQAELVAIPAANVVAKPPGVSTIEAASVGAVAITAVHALRDLAGVRAGQRVLINGASGGVGLAAIQVAKALGARVTAVCGGASADLVRSLGADDVVDYKTTDFTRGPGAYDVVFDCIGNAPCHRCAPILADRWVHVTTMADGRSFARMLLNFATSSQVKMVVAEPTPDRLELVRAMLADGRLKPVVERVLPFGSVVEAQAHSESGRAKGKLVLTFARPT
jgi:NADPH:quinone reductase-like Zn-dependent oxidoreductase